MSASSSDSWILIALTILVVLLLFYLSKKMICNSYGSTSEDTTTSPSSSTASASTSFSDYLYQSGYDGRSSLNLMDATATTTSNAETSPDIDDLAIDIANSVNCPGHHHHYRVDNGRSRDNYNCNNNSNHARNNLDLGNGRGMSFGDEGRVESVRGNMENNNRGMDFSGSPTSSSTLRAAVTESQQPIFSPISIIAGPAFDRKTMLETQLRNQIAKIVQAELEIQRLVLLLSLEQRQGSNVENNVMATSRASCSQHSQRHPQAYHHLRGNISPSVSSALTTSSSIALQSSTETGEATGTATESRAGAEVTSSLPSSNCNSKISDPLSASLPQENTSANVNGNSPLVDNSGDGDRHQNDTTETSSPENHQYICHSSHHQNENPENHLCFPDFHTNSNFIQNPAPHRQQPNLSCGLGTSTIATFHRQPNTGCNFCFVGSTETRRMLMLRRMFLPISSVPITAHASVHTYRPGLRTQRDVLPSSVHDFSCNLHCLQEGHHHLHHSIPDLQSGLPCHLHHHPRDNYLHPADDEPPPLYEECVGYLASNSLNYNEEYNHDLYNNCTSNTSTRSSTSGNQVEQALKNMNV